ncbi:MAG: GGDEF domain-containing protein, partial [Erysipelotrichaceae bacterium]|nr:GGDEF domain-containing protein [Erysipelotrichaceae bacterium]
LKIDTGDEIETLHKSMIQMEKDIDNYIQNLIETRQQLTTSKKEAAVMNELAHKDSLTGIRNKLAYDQEEAKLRKEFKQGKRDFGLAIVDLNDLKGINDTYGHEYGNIALKNISQLICEVFLHSPVFRIGGDEFAIILKNNDYDKIETLVAEFNERLAKQDEQNQEPWERVKGAIGYALYDPELDSSVDDVFRRADQDMYQKKKAMKGENVR